jgi:hypothetical protein
MPVVRSESRPRYHAVPGWKPAVPLRGVFDSVFHSSSVAARTLPDGAGETARPPGLLSDVETFGPPRSVSPLLTL